MEVYAASLGVGSAEAIAAVGPAFQVSSGAPLTQSFSAPVTVSAHLHGHFNCVNAKIGGTDASLRMVLVQWRWAGSWVIDDQLDLGTYNCVFLNSLTTNLQATHPLTFNPGALYALMVEAHAAEAMTGIGTASVDFYGLTDGSLDPEYTKLTSISIPNQPPKSLFFDTQYWYVYNLLYGTFVEGVTCDYDGQAVHGGVSIDNSILTLGATSSTADSSSACVYPNFRFKAALPGTYRGSTAGRDNDAATSTRASGSVAITILPNGPFDSSGDTLASIADSAIGSQVNLTLIVRGESLVGGRLVSDGKTMVDTVPALDPRDHVADIAIDRAGHMATIRLDGQFAWAGKYRQQNDRWWDIETSDSLSLLTNMPVHAGLDVPAASQLAEHVLSPVGGWNIDMPAPPVPTVVGHV